MAPFARGSNFRRPGYSASVRGHLGFVVAGWQEFLLV
jgi:hypothetical protein